MGRVLLRFKNTIKGTLIGRKARNAWQRRHFTYENAEKAYRKYSSRVSLNERESVISDMLTEAKKYNFGFDEYFMYGFYHMQPDERRTYVSDRERTNYCERLNKISNMIIFDDKLLTYKHFEKYYGRRMVGVYRDTAKQRSGFVEFVKDNPKFIVKPFDGACGVGIKIIDTSEKDPIKVFSQLRNEYKRGFVAEELIVQSNSVAMPHPQSVNTVRITTIRYDDRVDIIHPFWRTGRGDACVDNGGSGGIICAIDKDSGTVIAAADEAGNHYEDHPDTGVQLVGYQIPYWEDAVHLAKELSAIIPDNRYTGWDFALTDNGWVLQEANDRGAFVGFQLPIHKGFRREIEQIMTELNL